MGPTNQIYSGINYLYEMRENKIIFIFFIAGFVSTFFTSLVFGQKLNESRLKVTIAVIPPWRNV